MPVFWLLEKSIKPIERNRFTNEDQNLGSIQLIFDVRGRAEPKILQLGFDLITTRYPNNAWDFTHMKSACAYFSPTQKENNKPMIIDHLFLYAK